MLRAAICSFMKLSIFTGDAFAPIFSKTKSPVARYNSISSTDCFSFLPFTSLLSYRSRESPDCGSFGNEHFLRRLPFLHSGTLYPFVDASLTRRVIVRFCPCLPEPLSASFDIISILCSGSLLRHHTHQYAHRPFGCALFLVWQVSSRILFSFANASISGFFHARTLLSCCLDPLASSVRFTDGYHEDSFLKGAVPYFIQKSIALFRRFVLIFWNSLILIAITLIVSVTASRRVPRTDRMSLLLPLDSPLSPVVFGCTPVLSE